MAPLGIVKCSGLCGMECKDREQLEKEEAGAGP